MLFAVVPEISDVMSSALANVERSFPNWRDAPGFEGGGYAVPESARNARDLGGCLDGLRGLWAEDLDVGGG